MPDRGMQGVPKDLQAYDVALKKKNKAIEAKTAKAFADARRVLQHQVCVPRIEMNLRAKSLAYYSLALLDPEALRARERREGKPR